MAETLQVTDVAIPFKDGRPAHERNSIKAFPMPSTRFVYRARIDRVVDGDTLDVEIDQGLHSHRIERVRLLGINCPEKRGETRLAGLAAEKFVAGWIFDREVLEDFTEVEWPFTIQTEKSDAFGRYLAHVWCAKTGDYLNKAIIDAGHAVPYKEK